MLEKIAYRLNAFVLRMPELIIFGNGFGIFMDDGICEPPKKNSGVLLDICFLEVVAGVKSTGLYPEFIIH